jgi:acetyl esterase/lipase
LLARHDRVRSIRLAARHPPEHRDRVPRFRTITPVTSPERAHAAGAIVLALFAACASPAPQTVKLWPGIAPGSETWTQHELVVRDTPSGTVVLDVVTPTLTAYLPRGSRAPGAAIIIAPGGYCVALAIDHEGTEVARWLEQRGIAAFVLKYRTKEKRQPGIPRNLDMDAACRYGIADAVQAIALVRAHASAWHVDPHAVGILGFSAGGMVASGALLQPDPAARPDFAALIYGAPFGTMPAVPAGLPPVFMAWAQDDDLARDAMAKFYEALATAGDRPEAHVFAAGGHGFGMTRKGTPSDHWSDELYFWLEAEGFTGSGVRRGRPERGRHGNASE